MQSTPVIIVGAGLSGLACAVRLHEAGVPVALYESSDGIGGRVRTDRVEGFLLDRGFQVYLDAYPHAGELLDLEALQLQPFAPGAMVYDGERLHAVMDVFRRPRALISSALAPIGSLMDKLRVALLRFRATGSSVAEIESRSDSSTEDFLRSFGFGKGMIDRFFRAFYGGIFLERELRTSSRMFEFTYKMFSEGNATLPALGMGAIPHQLAQRLPEDAIHLRSAVASVESDRISLVDGSIIAARAVVVATQATQTARMVPGFAAEAPEWRAVTNVYYKSQICPIDEPIIALNGTEEGLVNNVCVLNKVAPTYAPEGQNLISVSVLGLHLDTDLPERVKGELKGWFGPKVAQWEHLRTDLIKNALPEQLPGTNETPSIIDGVHICGDHMTTASIEGAIISGQCTADEIIAKLPSSS